ncbi:response regulator [Chelativorans sp.]|uniref:response regulator n=1 Tax=Chelativorans sp. TaxID=2203393 RepID=UPI002811E0FB|nr:response regulator [Chelativorans sp.]
MVLVVAASPINRIVISRTIERAGMRATTTSPETALDALGERRPAMVIVDEGGQEGLLTLLFGEIARLRAGDAGLPRVVLVVEPSQQRGKSYGGIVDAVVVKPLTPEGLQPIVQRLADNGKR